MLYQLITVKYKIQVNKCAVCRNMNILQRKMETFVLLRTEVAGT